MLYRKELFRRPAATKMRHSGKRLASHLVSLWLEPIQVTSHFTIPNLNPTRILGSNRNEGKLGIELCRFSGMMGGEDEALGVRYLALEKPDFKGPHQAIARCGALA